jgi:hypothetical protein
MRRTEHGNQVVTEIATLRETGTGAVLLSLARPACTGSTVAWWSVSRPKSKTSDTYSFNDPLLGPLRFSNRPMLSYPGQFEVWVEYWPLDKRLGMRERAREGVRTHGKNVDTRCACECDVLLNLEDPSLDGKVEVRDLTSNCSP